MIAAAAVLVLLVNALVVWWLGRKTTDLKHIEERVHELAQLEIERSDRERPQEPRYVVRRRTDNKA